MHPHINDISGLTDNDLEQKILDLQQRYWLSQNEQLRNQIILLLDDYKHEIELRRARADQKSQDNDENGLDNLIKVS